MLGYEGGNFEPSQMRTSWHLNIFTLSSSEIYLAIATLVMRFNFELYETTRDDIDFHMTLLSASEARLKVYPHSHNSHKVGLVR